VALRHHDLCFGCGRTNLFGLLAEIEERAPGSVAGRCFIKQDHQGSDPSAAHPGVIAVALLEAMSLAVGPGAWPASVQIDFRGRAPLGTFLELQGEVDEAKGTVSARAAHDTNPVASAVGSFTRGPELRQADPRGAPRRG
jgi:hypothetical protein